ncbi:MAG: acetyl-CoA carboxylase biotin carboxylase subunit [Actinobacteria bacterium]|nr:MAG: acetyl-CoA carboxylase biotin carboxylase subunit [Actinomycetota bacterium]
MKKLLVANRGEIAVRIMRAARELGIETVAVCSEADVDALHTRTADHFEIIGPAPANKSYLVIDNVIDAAIRSGADAVHPGYGFLSERAEFAERLAANNLIFVGPSPAAITQMGDKAQAIKAAIAAGVPTIPGSNGPVVGIEDAVIVAARTGYPVAVKASAGGGGRGIRIAGDENELRSVLPVAQAEALSAFGSGEVYIERMIQGAKHIEVQVFGDGENFVHLGERDCSVQRRRQKLIEETPAHGLPPQVREALCAAAVALAAAVGYQGAGTVEFLYEQSTGEFFFIEMNTRIQVEHPITEEVTGIDLVAEQLRVASGQPLSFSQNDVQPRGHAIEIRLNAENAAMNFLPSPGTVTSFTMPAGPFVRIDSGFAAGSVVSPYYDSLLAKIIVWGRTREEALNRARRAIAEIDIQGVSTTAEFLDEILQTPEFVSGNYDTTFLETRNT